MSERKLTMLVDMKDGASEVLDKVDNKMTGLGQAFQDVGKKMGSIGSTLNKKVTLPLVGVGTASIKTVSDFDDGMSRVRGLTGATGEQFEELREKAIELGQTTAFSASDASEGMQILAASGMEVNDIMDTSGDMFTLMSAGAVDADTAASVLTNTMAQFGLETSDSSRIVDVFSQGAASAKLGVEDLEYIMGQAGGTMASMNMDMEQSVAMAGQLADAGMPIGQVGSALNAMGREIKANADAFEKRGIDVYDKTTGKMKDMGTVMGELESQLEGKTDAQRDEILSSIFSGQAMKAATDWLSLGSEHYAGLTEEIYNAAGAGEEFAAENENNIGGALRSMGSSIETFMIRVGDVIAPTVQKVADFIADLADKFSGLDPELQENIVKFAGVAAAIGPVLSVGSKLLDGVGKFIKWMSPTKLGIGLLITAGVLLYKNWDTIREKFEGFKTSIVDGWNNIKEGAIDKMNSMKDGVSNAFNSAKESIEGTKESIKTAVTGTWESAVNATKETLGNMKDVVKTAFDSLPDSITEPFLKIMENTAENYALISDTIREAWELIKDIVLGALLIIADIVSLNFEDIGEHIDLIWGSISERFGVIWDNITQIFDNAIENVKLTLDLAWESIKLSVSTTFETISMKISSVWESVTQFTSTAWETIKETIHGVIEWLFTLPERTLQAGQEIMGRLRDGIAETIPQVVGKVKEVATSIMDTVKELPGKMFNIGKEMMSKLGEGIKNLAMVPIRAAGGVAKKIAGRFTGATGGGGGRGNNHRTGANIVPYDNYPANLHRGEMVLTASAARKWKQAGGDKSKVPSVSKPQTNNNSNIQYNPQINVTVSGNASSETAREFERRVEQIIEREREIFFAKLELQGV